MSHYAKIENGIVTNVIVADAEYIASQQGDWIQTSYNTYGGVHSKGGIPLRKNYAGIGFLYDKDKDAFIPPKPYTSWVLNENYCLWESPILKPNDKKPYIWNESIMNWEEIK